MRATFEPIFLQRGAGPHTARMAVLRQPATGAARALVVQVHAFAEEMNKTRRMAALQAEALAERGCAVLQIDLLGCGDSDGDFGDATWTEWIDDVEFACHWLVERTAGTAAAASSAPNAPLWLWGVRTGCLLAAQAAARLPWPAHMLFWQPVTVGKSALQQFLRLKAAADMLRGQSQGVTERLRAEIAAGRSVEVAGYRLSPGLCLGLDGALLTPPPKAGTASWFEVASRPESGPTPAAQRAAQSWSDAGWQVQTTTVAGPAFWQSTEIEEAPALVEASAEAVAPATVPSRQPGRDAPRPAIEAERQV